MNSAENKKRYWKKGSNRLTSLKRQSNLCLPRSSRYATLLPQCFYDEQFFFIAGRFCNKFKIRPETDNYWVCLRSSKGFARHYPYKSVQAVLMEFSVFGFLGNFRKKGQLILGYFCFQKWCAMHVGISG